MASEAPPPTELEIERFKHRNAERLELLKATIAFEHAALRPNLILNGGAILTALTFAGHISDGKGTAGLDFSALKFALIAWCIGLVLGTAAVMLGYFSQFAFLKHARRGFGAQDATRVGNAARAEQQQEAALSWRDDGVKIRNVAYIVSAGSLVFFIIGVFFAVVALS